jgi:WD40-like Beta Propeller Repeat
MRRIVIVAGTLLLLLVAAPAVAAPKIAYWGTSEPAVRTTDLSGIVRATVHRITYPFFSIGSGVVIGERDWLHGFGSNVVGYDATDGTKRFTIHDARLSLLHPSGSFAVFTPDSNGGNKDDRDPFVNSVWFHDVATGKEHRIARFPVKNPSLDLRAPIDLALNPKGTRVAIGHGNDGEIYAFDVWVARTHRSGTLHRLTFGGRSRWPSFSPDGSWIAYSYQNVSDPCSSEIRLIRPDGTGMHTVATGTCGQVLLRPVWISSHAVAGWWWDQHGPRGIVKVDTGSGATTALVAARVWGEPVVSRRLRLIAWRAFDGTIREYHLRTGTITSAPGGGKAWVSTVIAIDGMFESI